MPVEYGVKSNYAIEMLKWEGQYGPFGPPGRPYTFHEFPKRMYRAELTARGIEIVEAFTANDAHEQRNFESRGFHFGQDVAMDAVRREHTEHGTLAAEREHAVQHGRHSEAAVREIRAAEAEHGARHLPDVPEKPKRGRRKAAPVPA
jgi:hypothetical protein